MSAGGRGRSTGGSASATQKPLKVSAVEFHSEHNAIDHHTEEYESVHNSPATPVLRRGQFFQMGVRFQRPFDPNTDWVKLIFICGPRPNVARGTRVEVLLAPERTTTNADAWFVFVGQKKESTLTLKVHISVGATVGLWKCVVNSGLKSGGKKKRFDCDEGFYILFNPWCKDDPVFLANEAERHEYITNDIGKLYMGVHNAPKGRAWIFGQFDDIILPASCFLLDRGKVYYSLRGDPVKIVRAVAAVVNSRGEDGLLVDSWAGEYSDGTSPLDWTGSLKIFEEFMKSGGQPVKYGQCWVFSGCVTTICRALGIPCRSVTNYVSAHDCHQNLTVDKFFDYDGELKTDDEDQDAVWNFHVWNEVWMARPDLPKGYGGWQAIDATPQELSDDNFQLGPASVEAVRKGEIGLNYDTMFVVSEVNADVMYWQDDDEADIGLRKLKTISNFVGKKVLTKQIGKKLARGLKDAEDITKNYKDPEGSQEERLQMLNAAKQARLWYLYDNPNETVEDVAFNFTDIEQVWIGQPFEGKVTLHNNSNETRTVFVMVTAIAVYYTGVVSNRIKQNKREFVLQPQKRETFVLQVVPEDYLRTLVDHAIIKLTAIASVKETQQSWVQDDDFSIEKPPLNLQMNGKAAVKQSFHVDVNFTNPLVQPLENCRFSFEGPGLARPKFVNFRNVQGGEKIVHQESFVATQPGDHQIVATFASKQLTELNGFCTVTVSPK